MIRLLIYVLAFAGAALFTALLIHQGVGQVLTVFAAGGWGILGVVVFHLIPLFLDALAWWVLFPRPDRLPLLQLFWMRWIGESISALVPSAAIGGDIVRARLAAMHGASLPMAAGTVLVDITLGIFVQAGFTLLGLVLLVLATGKNSFVGPTLIGIVIASLVNIFLRSSGLDWVISIIGVGVFAGLTAYDTQRIKAMYDPGDDATSAGRKAVMGALTLYLDFINLFLFMLRFLGDRR